MAIKFRNHLYSKNLSRPDWKSSSDRKENMIFLDKNENNDKILQKTYKKTFNHFIENSISKYPDNSFLYNKQGWVQAGGCIFTHDGIEDAALLSVSNNTPVIRSPQELSLDASEYGSVSITIKNMSSSNSFYLQYLQADKFQQMIKLFFSSKQQLSMDLFPYQIVDNFVGLLL